MRCPAGIQKRSPEFRAALRLDPGNREAMGNLGTLFYDLGMPDSSRYYLARAKQARP